VWLDGNFPSNHVQVTPSSTCLERDWMGSSHPVTFQTGSSTVSIMPDTADTVIWAPDDEWSYHSKHVEQFANINKLYIIASCWAIIDITCVVFHHIVNTASVRRYLNKTAHSFLRGSFRTYSVYMTWRKDTRNAQKPWAREIAFKLVRHNVWYKIHLPAPYFAQLFPIETDGQTDMPSCLTRSMKHKCVCMLQ
jgi:hypothetical protein